MITIDKILSMNRQQIIDELKNYFKINELVCNHTYATFGEKSWQFLDTEYLQCLLILRTIVLKVPMVCNTTTLKQRGLRCNICDLSKDKTAKNQIYLSAHCNGAGGDFTSAQMTAAKMRELIKANSSLFPVKIRIEKDVNWLHFDVFDDPTYNGKVKEFAG